MATSPNPALVRVVAETSEEARLRAIVREAVETANKRLDGEIAPALRAEIIAEMLGKFEEMRGEIQNGKRDSFAHGHAAAMSKAWRYLVGGALVGFFAACFVYGVATMQGGYIAKLDAQMQSVREGFSK